MNKWMSEYLPHPLLRKCGSSLQYLWWNGFYCECSWGKQAEHILHMQHQDHLSWPGILRAPKSPPGIWSYLPASPLFFRSLGSSHTYSFFSSNSKLLSLSLKNSWVLCIFWSHLKCQLLRKMLQNFSYTQCSLFHSYLFFLHPFKKKFLSPEIDFIHLVHIIHHWVIKWAVGGEFGTWFPIHVSAVKGLCGLEQGFIYKLRAWILRPWTIPTQLPVYCDMILPVLCLHQHIFTIPRNFSQEEKTTLLYIPRTYLKDPSILQQKILADCLYP